MPSKDGSVLIPLLLTARRNLTLDGANPTILHAYGGEQQKCMQADHVLMEEVMQRWEVSQISTSMARDNATTLIRKMCEDIA